MPRPELAYVSLHELIGIRGKRGLPIDLDCYFVADKILSAYADEARERGLIIT